MTNDPEDHSFEPTLLSTETSVNVSNGGDMAWADVDGDGNLDVAILTSNRLAILQNDGNGGFIKRWQSAGLTGGGVAWGDYNNDGYWDLAVTGKNAAQQGTLTVYQGDGQFADFGTTNVIDLTTIALSTGVYMQNFHPGMLAWADLDNDGWPELIASGDSSDSSRRLLIFKNNQGQKPEFRLADFPFGTAGGYSGGALAVADYDNDRDVDLLLMGEKTAVGTSFHAIHRVASKSQRRIGRGESVGSKCADSFEHGHKQRSIVALVGSVASRHAVKRTLL